MSDHRPDFRAIKARVTMRDVLGKYGVELRKLNGKSGRGKCPLPTHDPEATEHTFNVDFGKNVWACHSSSCVAGRNVKKQDRSPKKGGDVLEFVQFMEKAPSLRVAGERLESWFGPFDGAVPEPHEEEVASVHQNVKLAFELQGVQFSHPYLTARGFDPEECEYLGVGFFPGKGSMANRVVFPIHNGRGELVAYAGRSIDDSEPRWKLPGGFSKAVEIYNIHRCWTDSEIVVCESFWGVLACVRAGILNAVAIMGNSISEWQAAMLAAYFKRVILMLDGDEFGRDAIGAAVGAVVKAEIGHIDLVLLPKGMQPDSLTPDELRRFLRYADMPAAQVMVEEAVLEEELV